ncbi:hypothetical protein H7F16_04135 [Gemmobacter straminiformis]|uniref:DNA adenine methylase n=1 Tax=Paragemmobacter straminiformis TaxID=2045119 RepID=A0A842I519_9RHOB|nr:hypothetical protein [Gemmobacter straminiformis]MBC2834681.1 hypothetical protein [Gemmobacter straminiformis]
MLFYLDPPYWGCEDDYGRTLFSRERFEDLAGLLRGLKGHFILSLNDLPEVRECFAGLQISEVTTTYTIAAGAAQGGRRELLISNWRLPSAACVELPLIGAAHHGVDRRLVILRQGLLCHDPGLIEGDLHARPDLAHTRGAGDAGADGPLACGTKIRPKDHTVFEFESGQTLL